MNDSAESDSDDENQWEVEELENEGNAEQEDTSSFWDDLVCTAYRLKEMKGSVWFLH